MCGIRYKEKRGLRNVRPTLEDQIRVSKMTDEKCIKLLVPARNIEFWIFRHCELLWHILYWRWFDISGKPIFYPRFKIFAKIPFLFKMSRIIIRINTISPTMIPIKGNFVPLLSSAGFFSRLLTLTT